MAELAAVSSIGGLLSLAIQVIEISNRYFSGVKQAPRTIRAYLRELEILRLVLTEIDGLSKDEQVARHFSKIDSDTIEACANELERLASKLRKRSNNSAFNRLTWPFAEEETRRVIEVLHRHQNSLHLLLSASSLKLNTNILQRVQSLEWQGNSSRMLQVISWLSVADPLENHTAARDKHEFETGQWFLDSCELSSWKSDPRKSMWINGIPGAGKTVLTSTIIDHLLRNQGVNDFIAYFDFDFSDSRKQTLEGALKSIIAQICYRAGNISEEVKIIFDKYGVSTQAAVDRASLISALESLGRRHGPIQIVLDALDESTQRGPLLDFLKDQAGRNSGSLQWLVTSRREQDISDWLSSWISHTVTLDQTCIDGDIRSHVRACLVRDPKLSSRPLWVRDRIEDALVHKAHGMFRWVDCQLATLRHCITAAAIESALADLPNDIDATYARILLSIERDQWVYVRAALQLLTFSKRRLTVQEIAEAVVVVPVCKPFDPSERLFEPNDIVTICAGLIVQDEPSGRYSLAHHSVQEYLLSDRIRQSPAGYFSLEQSQAHTHLAEVCLTYLLSVADFAGYHNMSDDFPFLLYAAEYWLDHAVAELQYQSSAVSNMTIQLLNPQNRAYSLWTMFTDQDRLGEKRKFHYGIGTKSYLNSILGHAVAVMPRSFLAHLIQQPSFLSLPLIDLWMVLLMIIDDDIVQKGKLMACIICRIRDHSIEEFSLLVDLLHRTLHKIDLFGTEILEQLLLDKSTRSILIEVTRRSIIRNDHLALKPLLRLGLHNFFSDRLTPNALNLFLRGAAITWAEREGFHNPGARGFGFASILHAALADPSDLSAKLISQLLRSGIDPNLDCPAHGRPLHLFFKPSSRPSLERAEVLKLLLDAGADPFQTDSQGKSALVLASTHGYMTGLSKYQDERSANQSGWRCRNYVEEPEILVQTILEHSIYLEGNLQAIEDDVASAFVTAPKWAEFDGTDTLILLGSSQAQDMDFFLSNFVERTGGPIKVLDLLLAFLARTQSTGTAKKAILSRALLASSKLGHRRAVETLLPAGADPNARSRISGATALELAAKAGFLEIVRLLLMALPPPSLKNLRTARDYARLFRHRHVRESLEEELVRRGVDVDI